MQSPNIKDQGMLRCQPKYVNNKKSKINMLPYVVRIASEKEFFNGGVQSMCT